MKVLICLFFLLASNVSVVIGQVDKKRVYEISVISHPQKVELIEFENGQFTGTVVTEITKGKRRTGFFNRIWRKLWNSSNKEITDISPIESKIVKELMTELQKNGIESIENCIDDEECSNYGFLDSGSVYFKIISPEVTREYEFDEIYPLHENNKEETKLRIEAQKLITILYKYVDLEQEFSNLFKRLPRGHYHWYQASGHAIVTIRNRKRVK